MGIAERRARALRVLETAFAPVGAPGQPNRTDLRRTGVGPGQDVRQALESSAISPTDEDLLGRWAVQTLHGSGQAAYVPSEIHAAGARCGIRQMDNEHASRYASRVCNFLNGHSGDKLPQ